MCRLTWGGYLGLSPSFLKGLFHFAACLCRPHSPSPSNTTHPSYSSHVTLTPPHPSCDILSQAPNPCFLFLFVHPSIHPSVRPSLPALHRSPSLSFTLLCSALTLSGLPHVLLQAYSVPDAEFYCHSLCTGTLGVRSVGDFFHYTGFRGYSF